MTRNVIALNSSLIQSVLFLGVLPLTLALDLSRRNLADMPPDIPAEETRLDLSRNMLTTIRTGAFSRLKNLTTLWLFNNQIYTIEPGAFDGPSRLEYLHIGSNKLEFVPDVPALPILNGLILRGNPLHSMEIRNEENLKDSVYLEELNFGWTWRKYFPPFPFLQNMKRFNLVGNSMRKYHCSFSNACRTWKKYGWIIIDYHLFQCPKSLREK